jgi:hypothetical protein
MEKDAQMLANRINLLKQEEIKARRKINETRKRASDVEAARDRNDVKLAEKEEREADE